MAYPLLTDLNTAISNIELALREDETIPGTIPAWEAFKEVTSFLRNRVPGTSYSTLTEDLTNINGV